MTVRLSNARDEDLIIKRAPPQTESRGPSSQKLSGAYYTPDEAVRSLCRWAIRDPSERLLDPSCGDGRFLSFHKRSVGVEQDAVAAEIARARAPWALVHEGDFFSWAASTKERFECAAGNPPFIRYQHFSGAVRERAAQLCKSLNVKFSGLASSWAPFLVGAASLLRPGGRIAFVVPAEIGHAPYAQPLLEYLCGNFADIRLFAIRKKLFAALAEDVWLLFADRFGERATGLRLVASSEFAFSDVPPSGGQYISLTELRAWGFRLRPFLATGEARDLYRSVAGDRSSRRLGSVASVGIGYVTGANEFFHLRPSQVVEAGIPRGFLKPTVRNGRLLIGRSISQEVVKSWLENDEPALLLHLPKTGKLPRSIHRYLETEQATQAKSSYKCRTREPWYVVPDVTTPDAFLSYMSSETPALVLNEAKCACTNSVHAVKLRQDISISEIQGIWRQPFTQLSCEFEGHPLGGGMLKVEPREAQNIILSFRTRWSAQDRRAISEAIETMRGWRHVSTKGEAALL